MISYNSCDTIFTKRSRTTN